MSTNFSPEMNIQLYNQALVEWKRVDTLPLEARKELLTKLMILWYEVITENPNIADPRGEAPSSDFRFCYETLSWEKYK